MSTLHALLIGIDDYIPDRLPDGSRYPSLHGATSDVLRMALLLRDREALTPERTRLLLSRAGEDGLSAEPPERRPTYANIVAAFQQLALEAEPGDRVYIHYSGHGTRTPTEYPGIKGLSGQDESLVPCDIGDPGSRYLHDLELAALVRRLVDRDLHVTLVLDCCHAGGAMRGRGKGVAVPRRVPWVPRAPVPSAVADPQALTEIWSRQQREGGNFRGLTLQSWLPKARYVLFAACRPDEDALEFPFEDGKPQGALTYWLLDTLHRFAERLSCREIHQRLVARIRGTFASQTPMLFGDGGRGFLDPEGRRSLRAFPESPMVLRVNDDGQVLVDVGMPAGAKIGDRVLLKGSPSDGAAAELTICRVGATESWAEVTRLLGPEAIEPGMRADFLRLRTAVRLIPPERRSDEAEQALARLAQALKTSNGSFVEVLGSGHAPDLCVTVDESAAYEILDAGGTPFPNLGPLRVTAPEVVTKVICRLDHLAKFRNILTVENPRPAEWLGIGLELSKDNPQGDQPPLPSRALDLRAGDALIVRIVNRSKVRLDFVVLDLAPDYSVTQLLPKPGSLTLLPLDPGRGEVVRVRGWLPPGYTEGNDVLKVFATQGASSFRWLELPPLGRPMFLSNLRGDPKTPLENLFAQLTARRPAKRSGLNPSEFPEEEWITAQVEIRVWR